MAEPELSPEQVRTIALTLGIPERMVTEGDEWVSKDERAEKILGRRVTTSPEGHAILPFDQPVELGYWCPVCQVPPIVDGQFDERLHWSEYNSMLWCSVCNVDYPSALCIPLFTAKDPDRSYVYAGVADATKVFLDIVQTATERIEKPLREEIERLQAQARELRVQMHGLTLPIAADPDRDLLAGYVPDDDSVLTRARRALGDPGVSAYGGRWDSEGRYIDPSEY